VKVLALYNVCPKMIPLIEGAKQVWLLRTFPHNKETKYIFKIKKYFERFLFGSDKD